MTLETILLIYLCVNSLVMSIGIWKLIKLAVITRSGLMYMTMCMDTLMAGKTVEGWTGSPKDADTLMKKRALERGLVKPDFKN